MTLIPYGLDATTKKGRVGTAGEGLVGADGGPLDVLDVAAHTATDHTGIPGVGKLVDRARAVLTTALAVGVIPSDATIPQDTEGTQILTVQITPKTIGNKIKVSSQVIVSSLLSRSLTAALFVSGQANALAAMPTRWDEDVIPIGAALNAKMLSVEAEFTTTSLSLLTFSLRVGESNASAGVVNVGGIFGGAAGTFIEVEEFTP